MANSDKDSHFTKENLEQLLNFGKHFVRKLVLEQLDNAISEFEKLSDKTFSEIKNLFNPNTRFANMLKAKYDALVAAGFSREQAFELALKAVEETLRQATQEKGASR